MPWQLGMILTNVSRKDTHGCRNYHDIAPLNYFALLQQKLGKRLPNVFVRSACKI